MGPRSNRVRIISGNWRGRKLAFPDSEGLRPTPDRLRETLFNWLAPSLPGAHCLDLFAGSGALGFEAASRGAARVVMVDDKIEVIRALRGNSEKLSASNIVIVHRDAAGFLSDCSERFDVMFLDPPFQASGLLSRSIDAVRASDLLNAGALVYLEWPVTLPEPDVPPDWALVRRKSAGQVCSRLYRRG
jgi:16S rRNA (guanine966-N2)-methyltransferase